MKIKAKYGKTVIELNLDRDDWVLDEEKLTKVFNKPVVKIFTCVLSGIPPKSSSRDIEVEAACEKLRYIKDIEASLLMVLAPYITVDGNPINGNDIAYICALEYGSGGNNYMFDTCYQLSVLGDFDLEKVKKDWGITKEESEELKAEWRLVGIAPENVDFPFNE